jgi:precorrin-6B methylase 2
MHTMRVARWTTAAVFGVAIMQGHLGPSLAGTPDTLAARPQAQAAAQQPAPAPSPRRPDVMYVPTRQEVVTAMLKLAAVTKDDVVYDLGCGDGRIPVTAARDFGARGVGIDIDPQRITEANANVKQAGVGEKVKIMEGDLFEADIRPATVVTLYLLQGLNEKLKPKLMRDLKPGTRIVSHAFDMGDWQPDKTEEISGARIFLWTIPAKK